MRARAAFVVGFALGLAGCCPMLPDAVVCTHCACTGARRSLSAPLSCSAVARDVQCCPPVMLAPPSLPTS